MKKIYLIQALAFLIIISACDTTKDFYAEEEQNQKPNIIVKGPYDSDFDKKEQDSIKINEGEYLLFYKIIDEEKLNLKVSWDEVFSVQFDDEKIVVSANEMCKGNIQLSTQDSFGASDIMNIQLTFYGNLRPIAILEIEDVANFPYEKKIDASKSYDPDEKYGGKIVLYQFRINGKIVQKEYHPYMYYTFPRAGQYRIDLEVQDNDGEWSAQVYKTLTLH